jgi:hypothetical protein
MKIFALSDPHLALATPGKEMDRFGDHWLDHAGQIASHWRATVGAEDLVLVPGDISWALRLPQALPDLDFLGKLPGRKVLLKGNHDFWWGSISRVRQSLAPGMWALQADAVRVEDVVITGTRYWDDPDLSFQDVINWQPNPQAAISSARTEADAEKSRKIFVRECARLQRALQHLDEDPQLRSAPLRIALTHYPPCGPQLQESFAATLFPKYGIHHAVFGHLHAVKKDLDPPPFGRRGNVHYHLTSCDYLDFKPLLIDEV